MIDTLEIKNFRCYDHLSLKGFGAINVIVGGSGSGKTALLESIFLGQGGSPEICLRLRQWRGLGDVVTFATSREGFQSLWKDLFYDFDENSIIELAMTGSPENTRGLTIRFDKTKSFPIPLNKDATSQSTIAPTADSSVIIPIVFTHKNADGDEMPLSPSFGKGTLSIGGLAFPSKIAFYSSSFATVIPPSEPAIHFSELNKHKKANKLRRLMSRVFPDIKDISVEANPVQCPCSFVLIPVFTIKFRWHWHHRGSTSC